MTSRKIIILTICTFVGKVMPLLFNILSRFVTALIPRNKHLLISWLQSTFAVVLEPKKIKAATVSTFPPSICNEVMELDARILVLSMLSFQQAFSPSSFTLIKRPLNWYLLSFFFFSHHLGQTTALWVLQTIIASGPLSALFSLPGTHFPWIHT